MTDMYTIHQALLKYNIPESDIITYFPEDIYKDKRNIMADYVVIDEDDKIKYTKITSKGYTVNDVLNGIRCNIEELKYINKSDNIFIYIIGHGCEGALKFYDKEWLTKDDLMRSLEILSRRVHNILLILDTCEAESIIHRDIDNMYIVTTSKHGEPSLSLPKNDLMGINTIDEFPFYFRQLIQKKDLMNYSLNDVFTELNDYDFSSTLTWTKNKNYKLRDFLYTK